MKLTKNEKRRELISMTKVQNHTEGVDFKINKGFNKIYKDILDNKGDLYKVIDLADGNQVLYFGGGHDDMGIGTFIFKNNAKTRKAFDSFDNHWQGNIGVDDRQGNQDSDYVIHCVTDYKVAPYKEDRKGKADIDWRTVRACKTLKDLVHYVDGLDVFDTVYSDKNWTGYDFCFATDKSRN
jgi:hypothetical protein